MLEERAEGVEPTVEAAAAAVATVSVKLPPFWPSDPEVWFAQVEAYFTTRCITAQRTRFDHFIASLSPEVATEVRDLILKPPEDAPYTVLKEQLIRRTAASEQRRLQQLFNAAELGDRKPTQLLRRMQQLLGDQAGITDSTFLRELFLQRLPSNVRMVLASTSTTATLEELAELADKVVEVSTPTVSATTAPAFPRTTRRNRTTSHRGKQTPDLPAHTHSPVTRTFQLKKSSIQSCDAGGEHMLVPPKVWRQCQEVLPPLYLQPVKRSGQPLVATNASGRYTCRLLHITDRMNKLTFLVDTGAQVSVLPPTRTDRLRKQEGFTLSAVNGTAIATYGTRSLTLNLGLRRTFR